MNHRSIFPPVLGLALTLGASVIAHAETQVSLSTGANVNALFNSGTKVTGGGIDLGGYAFAENLTGTSLVWSGSTFKFGSSGTPNGASNDTVTLPAGNFATLKLLAAGVNGNQQNQTFVVTYTDGTTTTINQSLSDWFYPQQYPGESKAVTTAYRVSATGATSAGPCFIYGYTFAINPAKTVKSIKLPANRDVVVMGMTLDPGASSVTSVNLAAASNVYGLFNNGSKIIEGGIDGGNYALSETLTGTSVTWSGSTFKLGSAGTANAASGTTVALPAGKFSMLKFLAVGVSGSQPNQAFVVTYSDGSTATLHQGISDWFYPVNFAGESIAVTASYRLVLNGSTSPGPAYVYGYSLAVDDTKTIKSVKLPSNRNVVVLGMTLTGTASSVAVITPPAPVTGTSTTTTASGSTTTGTATSGSGSSTTSGSGSSSTGSSSGSTGGTAAAPVAAGGITIDVSKKLSTISGNQLGLNLASAFDITQGNVLQALQTMGARMVRWPGGSNSDASHWKTMTYCDGAYQNPNSTFDNFMQGIVKSGSMQAAITVNYGSNQACTGGGDPTEAAAWVAYAKSKGYNSNVHYWTVGNEVYGGWEYDLHAQKNDPGTYAAAVAGSNGYYQLMKNADSTAQVGVVVEGMPGSWDNTVLTEAPYDFVELHWYAQQNGSESDSYLLTQAPADLRDQLATLREELSSAGKPNAPIMLGEFNSVNQNPGKQTMSVVNALFIGMTFGEVLNNGVAVATAWFGYDNSCHTTANNSSALYGWQNFGGYQLITENWQGCGNSPAHAGITTFPAGYAQGLVAQFAQPGGSMLSAAVGTGLPNIRAYASSNTSGGYSVMLFNLSATATTTVAINLANAGSNSYTATTQTYGKAQYDTSKSNVWTGPVSQSLGTVNGAAGSVTLPPYSMTVLQLK